MTLSVASGVNLPFLNPPVMSHDSGTGEPKPSIPPRTPVPGQDPLINPGYQPVPQDLPPTTDPVPLDSPKEPEPHPVPVKEPPG